MDNLIPVERDGKRVLTTQQLAEQYETEPIKLQQNYSNNKTRFQEKVHYFLLKHGEEGYSKFSNSPYQNQPIYLWTEKGCLVHAKSLGTDKAWDVFNMLVDTYFRVKELAVPKTKTEIIQAGYQALLEMVDEMKPKAEYFDALVDKNLLTNFRDTAKELKVKETDLVKWLETKKYIYRDIKDRIKPYAPHVPALFEEKEYANPRNNHVGVQTLITPKGRETFRLLLIKDGYIN